jgi:hypothetical protein
MNMRDLWKKIPGHFTWPDFYAWLDRESPLNAKLVEVGVLHGQSAAYLLELSHRRGNFRRLDLVDTFPQGTQPVRDVLEPFVDVLGAMHVGLSWDVAARYADGELDAVFLDADHALESVRNDIRAWWPKVRVGGVLAGHDYTPEIPGVVQAVTEAFALVRIFRGERFRGPLRDEAPGNFYPVWCVRKTGETTCELL